MFVRRPVITDEATGEYDVKGYDWDFPSAVYFMCTIVSTIGTVPGPCAASLGCNVSVRKVFEIRCGQKLCAGEALPR